MNFKIQRRDIQSLIKEFVTVYWNITHRPSKPTTWKFQDTPVVRLTGTNLISVITSKCPLHYLKRQRSLCHTRHHHTPCRFIPRPYLAYWTFLPLTGVEGAGPVRRRPSGRVAVVEGEGHLRTADEGGLSRIGGSVLPWISLKETESNI